MFIDRATIQVRAGKGGDGAVSFLREAFRPRGGPAGGDGGDGGSVILEASTHHASLRDPAAQVHYRAQNGRPGEGKNCTGKRGQDKILPVPPGTLVYRLPDDPAQGDEPDPPEPIADLTENGQTFTLARGGKGGQGNAAFATALNQAPRIATKGTFGDQGRFRLELKLIAEVGIVGLPNAGKSTFISRVSGAKPRIASYPFTTLVPNLGVAEAAGRQLVIADIPGLIEGASEGKGLGDDFLRHVERTRVLLHLIDATAPEMGGLEPIDAYRVIRGELDRYADGRLAQKPEVIALNKLDALSPEEGQARLQALSEALETPVHPLSAVAGTGSQDLLVLLAEALIRLDEAPPEALI